MMTIFEAMRQAARERSERTRTISEADLIELRGAPNVWYVERPGMRLGFGYLGTLNDQCCYWLRVTSEPARWAFDLMEIVNELGARDPAALIASDWRVSPQASE